ncbi:MAG: prolyl oligopeptidase family serine peptidase, partial [Pseudohongiellaceae bacterium]
ALYRQRSPLYHIDKIQAPVLLMQGMQDKVVPANQAQGIYERLREANPLTRLICFEQEGHGFRQPENQITALKEELAFYRQVLL